MARNWHWFRDPYLAAGETAEKRAAFRDFLRGARLVLRQFDRSRSSCRAGHAGTSDEGTRSGLARANGFFRATGDGLPVTRWPTVAAALPESRGPPPHPDASKRDRDPAAVSHMSSARNPSVYRAASAGSFSFTSSRIREPRNKPYRTSITNQRITPPTNSARNSGNTDHCVLTANCSGR